MKFSVPPQITRLALLAVAVVLGYSVARHFLVPDSFGQYGWYRGNALKELAAAPANKDLATAPGHYAGREACEDCHSEVVKKKSGSKHKVVACESCHGATSAHAEDQHVATEKITDPLFCTGCHEANPSRPASFPTVDVKEHAGKQACMECHLPHSPEEAP